MAQKTQLRTVNQDGNFKAVTEQRYDEEKGHAQIIYSHTINDRKNKAFTRFEIGVGFGGAKWCNIGIDEVNEIKNGNTRLKTSSFPINKKQLSQLIENLQDIHAGMID